MKTSVPRKKDKKIKEEKIIFLDIDGVFVTGKPSWDYLHPDKLDLFHGLVKDTKAKVVICSDWRIDSTISALSKYINPDNLDYVEIIGFTPVISSYRYDMEMLIGHGTFYPRGVEISAWMRENYVPDYYVIIDDNNAMTCHTEHLVKTILDIGLTQEHIAQATSILTSKVPPPDIENDLPGDGYSSPRDYHERRKS